MPRPRGARRWRDPDIAAPPPSHKDARSSLAGPVRCLHTHRGQGALFAKRQLTDARRSGSVFRVWSVDWSVTDLGGWEGEANELNLLRRLWFYSRRSSRGTYAAAVNAVFSASVTVSYFHPARSRWTSFTSRRHVHLVLRFITNNLSFHEVISVQLSLKTIDPPS